MTDAPFRYRVFGLRLLSERELPELAVDPDQVARPDVHLKWGESLLKPALSGLEALADGARMSIPGAGDYVITNGNRIEVRPEQDAPERNVRLFLLGSAMGLLLHQRGLLPLHANAVEIDGRAVAFMGESGAGKSTLAAWFHDRGCGLLSDDVCVVQVAADGQAWAEPGIPRFRLWREALNASGRSTHGLRRSFVGPDADDKWDLPANSGSRCQTALPLSSIYVLERGDTMLIEVLLGIKPVEAVFAHTYRGEFTPLVEGGKAHFAKAMALVAGVPVFRATRQWDLTQLDSVNQILLDHARKVTSAGSS